MNEYETQIVLLNNIADSKRKEGDEKEAAKLFSYAMALLSKHGASPINEAALLSNFGILLVSEGKYEDAIKLQKRALELDIKTGNPAHIAFSHHNLGFALVSSGDIDAGLHHLHEAISIRKNIKDYDACVDIYEALCTGYFEKGDFDNARRYAESARSLTPELKNRYSLRGVTIMLAQIEAKKGNWDSACKLAIEVVAYIEERRSKYHYLALDKYDSRYNKHYLTAIELFLQAKQYHSALNLIDRTRFRSGCDTLEGPRIYGSLNELGPIILPNVSADELILVEWIYPKYDLSFPIRYGMSEVVASKIITSIREGDPIKLDLNTEWQKHFNNTLRQTQCVIDAYKDEIDNFRRIILIPHGTQWQTPMAALKHPVTGNYLCESHEMLLSPSLRYCRITDHRPQVPSNKYLVIGDPTNDLPQARKEAEHVSKLLGCTPLLGSEAKKEIVLQMLKEFEYDVIHFACHGYYTGEGLHGVILSDGNLTDDEVSATQISANVVNIVACWSGMTDFSIWNELGGFIRNLLVSGVRNVVASVYPVGDSVGYQFSKTFYEYYLAQGRDHCKATKVATTAVAKQFSLKEWGGLYITGQR